MTNPARSDGPAVDPRHLLVIGAGPGLGGAIAHRFAQGGYRLTLLARRVDGLAKLAGDLADADAAVNTVAADASDPEGLRAGQIQPGTPFSPDLIAEKYWSVVQSDGGWQSEFRFPGT